MFLQSDSSPTTYAMAKADAYVLVELILVNTTADILMDRGGVIMTAAHLMQLTKNSSDKMILR